MKLLSLALAFTLTSLAPFQCSKPDPNKRPEDSAPQALFLLSERFHEAGDEGARRLVLETIVERYPSSREAQRAKLALEGRDVSSEPSSGDEAAN
ncbi:MAG: hypothetical protein GXY23_12615 [Myxococcales bacterium]|jgi:hypothetical protein|nr:hypothetical protein [Myxococcales bacterium]